MRTMAIAFHPQLVCYISVLFLCQRRSQRSIYYVHVSICQPSHVTSPSSLGRTKSYADEQLPLHTTCRLVTACVGFYNIKSQLRSLFVSARSLHSKSYSGCLGLPSAMLSLSRTPCSSYGNARARQSVAFRGSARPRAVQRPVAAAARAALHVVLPEATGPACQTLLDPTDHDYSCQEQFAARAATRLGQAQSALTALHELGFEAAQFAGGLAAGTWLAGTAVVIAVPVPDYAVAEHPSHLGKLKQQLEGSVFEHVEIHGAVLSCSYKGSWLVLNVGSSEPVDVLQLLDPSLSTVQRAVLSCSTILASTAFLQDRPDLYRTAALVVKEWVLDELPWAYSSGYDYVCAHDCNHNR